MAFRGLEKVIWYVHQHAITHQYRLGSIVRIRQGFLQRHASSSPGLSMRGFGFGRLFHSTPHLPNLPALL